jgi:hypothetical protein
MDPKIRLVTICDNDGKIIYSDHREGVKNLLSPEESKESLEMALLIHGKYVLNLHQK